MFHHAIGIFRKCRQPRFTAMLVAYMSVKMHTGRVEPDEEWCVLIHLTTHEVDRGGGGFVVDRFHPLSAQRAGILDLAIGRGLDDATRAILFAEGRILRVVAVLRLLLGVEVIEVAEELVEAVRGRQELVAVAEVVLAELPGGVAELLERGRDGHVPGAEPDIGAGQTTILPAGWQSRLALTEGRQARRATQL